jgi:hypothetical protein
MRWSLFLLLLPLAGCPDSPSSDDDDDDAVDDDDATSDPWAAYCEGRGHDSLDLTDADTVARLVMTTWLTSSTFPGYSETTILLETPLAAGDPSCPTVTGEPPSGTGHFDMTLTGGCASVDEFRFDGSLRLIRTEDTLPSGEDTVLTAFDGDGFGLYFEPVARGPAFVWNVVEIDGTIDSWTESRQYAPGLFETDYTWELDGLLHEVLTPYALSEGLPLDWSTVAPEGYVGTLSSAGVSRPQGILAADVQGDLLARCRSSFTLSMQPKIEMESVTCLSKTWMSGPMRLSDAEHDVVIDELGFGACGGCLPWTVDGVEQTSPVCLLELLPPFTR